MSAPVVNFFLEQLPAESKANLLGQLQPIGLPASSVLFEENTRPRYVHFITSGVASTVTQFKSGATVEVGLVGREGFAERIHLLGPEPGTTRCFMQVPGSGLRMEFRRFQKIFEEDEAVHRLALRLVQFEAFALAQLSACNRMHEVEERLARWLLMVRDRAGAPETELTQEFLADMLGARRSTVNISVGTLQRAGLIEYRRGHVKIIDEPRLEDTACECYPIMRRLLRDIYKEPDHPNGEIHLKHSWQTG